VTDHRRQRVSLRGVIRAALALSFVAIATPRAHADPARADALAAEAETAATAGRFDEAAAKFSAAFKEDPSRPSLFCNVGVSYFKAQDLPRADLLLRLCLDRANLDASFIQSIHAVLDSIEATMRASGHAEVTFDVVPPKASLTIVEFGDDAVFTGPRTVWLKLGTHHVHAHADGFTDKTTEVRTDSTAPNTVEIQLERPTVVEPPPPPPPIAPVATAHRSKLLPLLATGFTVGSVVVMLYSISRANGFADDAGSAIDDDTFQDDVDHITIWNRMTVLSGSFAVIGAGLSGYLWYRALHSPTTNVEVAPTSGGATLTFSRRF